MTDGILSGAVIMGGVSFERRRERRRRASEAKEASERGSSTPEPDGRRPLLESEMQRAGAVARLSRA